MKLSNTLIVFWAIFLSLVLSLLMARHYLPFALPEGLSALGVFVAKTYDFDEDTLVGVHVLDPRCACSLEIINFLSDKKTQGTQVQSIKHMLVLLSDGLSLITEQLKDNLIGIHIMTAEEAKSNFLIETVPWFMILDHNANILYSGGYSFGRIRDKMDIQIGDVVNSVLRGYESPSLPAYGCVTSQELRRKLLQVDWQGN